MDILGHIFEQSITDLERLRQELEDTKVAATSSPALSGTLSSIPNGGEGRGEEALDSVSSAAPLPNPLPARPSRGEGVGRRA